MARKEEIGVVVDDFDNVLAYKKFGDMEQSERRRDTSVMLFNDKGELLIAKRSSNKSVLPNYWGPTASGSVESHENYQENIYKELAEEVGITDIELEFIGNFYFDFKEHKRFSGLFKGKFNGDISKLKLQTEEVDEIRWISISELLEWIKSGQYKVVGGMTKLLNAAVVETPPETVEFVYVVDEYDKVLFYKERKAVTKKDRYRIVVAWIEDRKGNVLIQKRSMNKSHGAGLWENAAGGGVSHLGSYEQAAYKELEEEIGISNVKLDFVKKTIVKTPRGQRYCGWYKGIYSGPISALKLQKDEVMSVKWTNKKELIKHREENPENYMPSSIFWKELFN